MNGGGGEADLGEERSLMFAHLTHLVAPVASPRPLTIKVIIK